MSAEFREFKIDGEVGEPGESGKLTFWSLLYQLNSGIERGFEESEIIYEVIQAMEPGNTTRTYLEGRRNLTVAKLIKIMRGYFGEGSASEIYKQMPHRLGTKLPINLSPTCFR